MLSKRSAELELKPVVTVGELRQLLTSMQQYKFPVKFRYRLGQNAWEPCFTTVIQLTVKGVLLEYMEESRIFFIPNLSDIKQFELNCSWRKFDAGYHFEVRD